VLYTCLPQEDVHKPPKYTVTFIYVAWISYNSGELGCGSVISIADFAFHP